MDKIPNMNRRSLLIGMAAASTAAAPAAGAPALAESPALLAAYDKLLTAKTEHAAATDALEWLADEWRHRWPLAPEEILGGANAHIYTASPDSMERDIIGRPLLRDAAELTKRLSIKQRRKGGRSCYHIDSPEYLARRLANWEASVPVGQTEKSLARNRASKASMVETLKASLPLSRQYHAETQRLREVSGANAAQQRVAAAKTACEAIEAKIRQIPALTMTGVAIKASLLKATIEAHSIQNLGGFIGDSYRIAVAVLDVVPVPGGVS